MDNTEFYGLTAGMTYEEVKRHTISLNPQPDLQGEWYSFYPEKEDFPYKYYSCKISRTAGLTRICAWTQNIKTKNNGAELFSLFEHIRDKELQFYHNDRFYHVLKDDALYNKENQFTLSLINSERILLSVFAPQFNSSIPNDCRYIQLQAYARDEYSGNVMKRISFLSDTDE